MITRWEPFGGLFQDMGRMRREMDRVFGRLGEIESPELSLAYPPVNVWEDADNVYVEVELPGMKREDLTLEIKEGNQLMIQGERKPVDMGTGVWYRQEREFGPFRRLLMLPFPVEAPKVEALFEHGVLSIKLPRTEAVKPRRIPVVEG